LSNARSEPLHIAAAGQDWPLRLVRHAAARRYRLVFDVARGELRLTIPRRASERQALAWAQQQQAWIAGQVGQSNGPIIVSAGTSLPVRGTLRRIDWDERRPRKVADDGVTLLLGGPAETVGARIGRWQKAEALALLDAESREIAAAHGIGITSVGVGDPKSRWGSCASDGRLRYSWRLIMAPDAVRRATVAHEVAHRIHMHHGPEFHTLVDVLNGGPVADARRWLKAHGRELQRYRFI
jgi:hypothetical protein